MNDTIERMLEKNERIMEDDQVMLTMTLGNENQELMLAAQSMNSVLCCSSSEMLYGKEIFRIRHFNSLNSLSTHHPITEDDQDIEEDQEDHSIQGKPYFSNGDEICIFSSSYQVLRGSHTSKKLHWSSVVDQKAIFIVSGLPDDTCITTSKPFELRSKTWPNCVVGISTQQSFVKGKSYLVLGKPGKSWITPIVIFATLATPQSRIPTLKSKSKIRPIACTRCGAIIMPEPGYTIKCGKCCKSFTFREQYTSINDNPSTNRINNFLGNNEERNTEEEFTIPNPNFFTFSTNRDQVFSNTTNTYEHIQTPTSQDNQHTTSPMIDSFSFCTLCGSKKTSERCTLCANKDCVRGSTNFTCL